MLNLFYFTPFRIHLVAATCAHRSSQPKATNYEFHFKKLWRSQAVVDTKQYFYIEKLKFMSFMIIRLNVGKGLVYFALEMKRNMAIVGILYT